MTSVPNCSVDRFGRCDEPTDQPSPEQFVPEGVNDGRRVYIHEESFHHLASHGRDVASMIYSCLVALPVVKLVHHDLTEEAVAVEGFAAAKADALAVAITTRWFASITEAFHGIGIRADGKALEDAVEPLLAPDEAIVATCLDSNYYTFATTERAAVRMYADVLKLSKVRRYLSLNGDAYRDLTMIKGRRLAVMRRSRSASHLASSELDEIKRTTMDGFASELTQIIRVTVPSLTIAEERVLSTFKTRCLETVRRTILHL